MPKLKDRTVGEIYETYNYDQFRMLLGNRDVEESRLKKIEDSLCLKQLPIPIIVNEKMEVIDGQGRLTVCKKHGFPIRYIICNGLNIDDCVTANVSSTQWNSTDIVRRYAKTGGKDYARLLEVIEAYGVNCNDVFNAAGRSNTEKEKKKKFAKVN